MSETQISLVDEFEFKVKTPSTFKSLLMWFFFFILTSSTFAFLGLGASGVVLTFLILGALVGRLWSRMGRWLANRLVIKPLKNIKDLDVESKGYNFFVSQMFGKNINKIFLQFETYDMDISTIKKYFKESFRIVIPFLAITLTILRIMIDTGIILTITRIIIDKANPNINQVILIGLVFAFILAFPALGFYLPLSRIVEDSRIMIILQKGDVEFAGGRIRRQLDGLFSVTGLLSGYTLAIESSDGVFEGTFIFIGVLIIMIILGVPILFPALFVYFRRHEALVNDFRSNALAIGIYPARTRASPMTSDELRDLVVGEQAKIQKSEGKNFLSKIQNIFVGSIDSSVEYSELEIEQFEKFGAWICSNCNTINNRIEHQYCLNCGNKRSN